MATNPLYNLLKEHNQDTLLSYLQTLGAQEREKLEAQLEKIDFSIFDDLWTPPSSDSPIFPMDAMTIGEVDAHRDAFTARGLASLQNGEIGVLILAGGQGTRLGADGPKGAVNIGISRPYYIFQALFETMKGRAQDCGRAFPVYIMTGAQNHNQTVDFLTSHDFFGYPADRVHFFLQQMTPATDYSGNILLSSPDTLALSPNGNGGWFASFVRAGLDKDADENGVKWLNVIAVDNVLQKIADPTFIGATLESGALCGAKVIDKNCPTERVGVLCKKDGHPYIVEYYEMSDAQQHETTPDGKLRFRFGVILNYLFSIAALRALPEKMPIHRVEKKVPYYDIKTKETVKPTEPNAHKYETLVLDMIAGMPSCFAYEVVREREFAPIKNATGVDSVESARDLLAQNGVKL